MKDLCLHVVRAGTQRSIQEQPQGGALSRGNGGDWGQTACWQGTHFPLGFGTWMLTSLEQQDVRHHQEMHIYTEKAVFKFRTSQQGPKQTLIEGLYLHVALKTPYQQND